MERTDRRRSVGYDNIFKLDGICASASEIIRSLRTASSSRDPQAVLTALVAAMDEAHQVIDLATQIRCNGKGEQE